MRELKSGDVEAFMERLKELNDTAEAALKQIDVKGYLIPYTLDGKKLVKVGVGFSKETRNIDEYIVAEE